MSNETDKAVRQFIELLSGSNQQQQKPITTATAVKFLIARKFDIPKAVALYEQHELIRQQEGLHGINVTVDPLRSELETGKFTILSSRDVSGAAIALFTANLHSPLTVTHKTTLQGIVYQLDAALQSPETQKAGLVFIYDMSGSKYSNFDYDLSQKILTLLKGCYPAKLKKVLIVTAPLWFKAPFKILRLFVREKLRDRVYTVSVPQLCLHIPRDSLPLHLGGTLAIDHSTWLLHCYRSMTNREDETAALSMTTGHTPASITTASLNERQLITISTNNSNNNNNNNNNNNINDNSNNNHYNDRLIEDSNNVLEGHDSSTTTIFDSNVQDNSRESLNSGIVISGNNSQIVTSHTVTSVTADAIATTTNSATPASNATQIITTEIWTENPPSSASSGFSDDDSLTGADGGDPKTIQQIVDMVRERTRKGLTDEYTDIRSRAPDGTFVNAKMRNNVTKNRYTDVLCYDHSRVVLSHEDEDSSSDYINANFVDGYKQKNAYISTQGPLPKTSPDFWRMVWEQHCLVIVMTTRVMERERIKCAQYWETAVNGIAEYGNFTVKTIAIDANEDYTVTTLELKNLKTDETRNVSHWQFTSWPDYGVPSSAMAMLTFLQRVREQQAAMVKDLGDTWAGHSRGPPMIVHCSAGIGRTGTFITLDICISRLEDVGTVDIRGTVEKIRSQRAFSIQMPDQYVFCHLALIEYALDHNFLNSADLTGFDVRGEDSE